MPHRMIDPRFFITLCLGLLSLSFHFAPTYGALCAEVLVVGWSAMLLSATIALFGWLHPQQGGRWVSWAQIVTLVIGLLCTHVFVSINYLRGGDQGDDSYEARGR